MTYRGDVKMVYIYTYIYIYIYTEYVKPRSTWRTEATSRWFVGSSRSKRSHFCVTAVAMANFIRHPCIVVYMALLACAYDVVYTHIHTHTYIYSQQHIFRYVWVFNRRWWVHALLLRAKDHEILCCFCKTSKNARTLIHNSHAHTWTCTSAWLWSHGNKIHIYIYIYTHTHTHTHTHIHTHTHNYAPMKDQSKPGRSKQGTCALTPESSFTDDSMRSCVKPTCSKPCLIDCAFAPLFCAL
jgi:hypothetical protein